MPWVAAVGSIAGGLISAQGAQGAAATQAGAGQAAITSQERMLQEQRALLEPFRTGGLAALQRLISGIGPGGEFARPFAMEQALPTFQPFKMEESQAQKFATSQALDAMRSQMAVGGQALSSNAITGAGQLAGDIGSQYEQQAYNQWLASQGQQFQQALAGRQQAFGEWQGNLQAQLAPLQFLAGLGQSSAAGTAANIGAAGTNIAGLQTGIGNVLGAGQIGASSALGGAVGNIGQYLMLQQMMGGGGGSGGSGGYYLPGQGGAGAL